MKDYIFEYEDVGVYACAFELIKPHLRPGEVHLDIGCGEGAIASKIKDLNTIYVGLDINQKAISRLIKKGYEAHEFNASNVLKSIELIEEIVKDRSVCSISMLDFVEHLPFDNSFLFEISRWLREKHPSVKLVTSIPNFSHSDVSIRLMAGRWDYTDSGLLDRTHNNVLTQSSINIMFESGGWINVGSNNYNLHVSDQRSVLPKMYAANADAGIGKQLRGIKSTIDSNYQVHQFVDLWVPGVCSNKKKESFKLANLTFNSNTKEISCKNNYSKNIQNLCLADQIESTQIWSNVAAEYVVFSREIDISECAISSLVQDTIAGNERPVLIVESIQEQACIDILNLAPGPWIAIPTLAVQNYFENSKCRELTPEDWHRLVITSLVMCGLKIEYVERQLKKEQFPFFSSEPRITLQSIFEQNKLESAISNLWPGVNELREWLCLPERLQAKAHDNEVHQASAYIKHLESDLSLLNETCRRLDKERLEINSYINHLESDVSLLNETCRRLDKERLEINSYINHLESDVSLLNEKCKGLEIERQIFQANLNQMNLKLEEVQLQKEMMERSIGWKLTTPLRWFSARLRGLH